MSKHLPVNASAGRVAVPALLVQALPRLLELAEGVAQSMTRRAELASQTDARLALMASDRETMRALHGLLVDSADLLTEAQRGAYVQGIIDVALYGAAGGRE